MIDQPASADILTCANNIKTDNDGIAIAHRGTTAAGARFVMVLDGQGGAALIVEP